MTAIPRVGIVGTGWWGARYHLPALTARRDVSVATLCDPRRDVRTALAEQFGVPTTVEDLPSMLSMGLDGAVICSPNDLHAQHAIECLRAGCHVLCEKPLGITAPEARSVVEEVQRSGRELFMAYGWHYRGIWESARALLREPGCGNLRHGALSMVMPDYGLFGGPDLVGGAVRPQPQTWRDPAIGGGTIHAAFTHGVALLIWLVEGPAVRAAARIGGFTESPHRWLSGWVQFADGLVVSLEHETVTPTQHGDRVQIKLVGDAGALIADTNADTLRLLRHDGASVEQPVDIEERVYDLGSVTDAFVRRLHGASRNEVTVEVGFRATALIDALIKSATADGRPIDVES